MRLGLAGAGAWGRNYIRTIDSLANVRLALVATRNPQISAELPDGCAVVRHWRDLLDPNLIDGLIIATPTPTHGPIAMAAMGSGIPVLVEKPVTMNLAQAQALSAKAAEKQLTVMVDHTQLFHPAYRKLKSLLPDFGRPVSLRSYAGRVGPFRTDTPVLWDWGSHDVSMCLDIMNAMPVHAAATIVERATIGANVGESVEVHLEFPDHVAADILVSNILPVKTRRFTVLCERGTLVYDENASSKLVAQLTGATGEEVTFEPEPPLTVAVREFASAIASGCADLKSIKLGVSVVEVLSACATACGSH